MNLGAVAGAQSFVTIFEEYSGKIYRYLCSLVRDPGLAEDLAQDTFVKAYKALARGDQPANLNAWLYAIATNTALSALRRRRLVAWLPFVRANGEEWLDPAEGHEVTTGRRDLISRSLRDLPRNEAACLILRFEHGLTYDELASVLECSVPAAKMRLSRARAAFREAYLRHGEEV